MNFYRNFRFCKIDLFLAALMLLVSVKTGFAADSGATLTVTANGSNGDFSPVFYGLMTEEINHSYDGGLYAELIRNRAFKDDPVVPVGWSILADGGGSGNISLDTSSPFNSNLTKSLDLSIVNSGARVGVANDGFWGIAVTPHTTYHGELCLEAANGFNGPVYVSLESQDGKRTLATATLSNIVPNWAKYTFALKTTSAAPEDGRFVVFAKTTGTIRIGFASLFPPTFHNRQNGNRIDLMKKMTGMSPAFLRFPGGNYLDPGHYIWKNTIGPIELRPGSPGAWGYRTSEGLGLLEFFEWCEDLNMKPVLAVSDGRGWLKSGDVTPLVNDALDEIEYATGSTTTKWGAKRAKDGHPKPFTLQAVEIGNEDFFAPKRYDAVFTQFFDAIRAKYPHLPIIATMPVTTRRPDLVDEHYYRRPMVMLRHADDYDSRDRSGSKVFVGEWATRYGTPPTPSWWGGVCDAAVLVGMERNADLVRMECYAPLLVNVNPEAYQCVINLIGYDSMSSYGSPSYYVQKMFAASHGDTVLPVVVSSPTRITNDDPTGDDGGDSEPGPSSVPAFYASASATPHSGEIFLHLVNASSAILPVNIDLNGANEVQPTIRGEYIAANDRDATNTIDQPNNVAIQPIAISEVEPHFKVDMPAYSVMALVVKVKSIQAIPATAPSY
jgi:alpha-N-arabinofuranosidase